MNNISVISIWNIDLIMPDGEKNYLEWKTSLSASQICEHFENKGVTILKLERIINTASAISLIKPKNLTKGASI